MDTQQHTERVKVLIIGSGPAGYTAGIYASRANLAPVLYEGMQPGGQLTTTSEVENFPGYPEGVNGTQLMEDLRKQAERFGTQVRAASIERIDFNGRPYKCLDEHGKTIEAETIILCTGASARYLGLPDEEKYRGMGVSACAVCDGFFYRGLNVAVVGGGDSACEEAVYLASLAKKVYLIVRKDYLRASHFMKAKVANTPNIEVLFICNVTGLTGEGVVQGADIVRHAGLPEEERFRIDIDGFFLAIGHKPNTELFGDHVELDDRGFVRTQAHSQATNLPGVFAAGDVCDPSYQQAITAAGTGCRAALDAERFLLKNNIE